MRTYTHKNFVVFLMIMCTNLIVYFLIVCCCFLVSYKRSAALSQFVMHRGLIISVMQVGVVGVWSY